MEEKFGIALFDPITAGLAIVTEKYSHLTDLTPDEMDHKLTIITGLAEVKAAKKSLTSMRTAIATAHKAAKAPLVVQGKAIDKVKKTLEVAVRGIEQPLADGLDRLKASENAAAIAKAAADAQKVKDLEAKLAAAEEALEANGIQAPQFVPNSITLGVTTRAARKLLGEVIGKDNVQDLYQDGDNYYALELTVTRKEIIL